MGGFIDNTHPHSRKTCGWTTHTHSHSDLEKRQFLNMWTVKMVLCFPPARGQPMEFVQKDNDVIATLSFFMHRPLPSLTTTTLLTLIYYYKLLRLKIDVPLDGATSPLFIQSHLRKTINTIFYWIIVLITKIYDFTNYSTYMFSSSIHLIQMYKLYKYFIFCLLILLVFGPVQN